MRTGLHNVPFSIPLIPLFAVTVLVINLGCGEVDPIVESYEKQFQSDDVTPSIGIAMGSLKSLNNSAQFGDAIGLEKYGYVNPFNISYVRQDHGDGTRVLNHNDASYEIYGDCAASSLTKRGLNGEVIYTIYPKGHTHSTGVFALKRQLACVTISETQSSYWRSSSKDALGIAIPVWETRSAIEVYSLKSGELLSTITMPGGTFQGILALSADERYIYVGGKFFLRRFEIPNFPEK